MHFFRQAIYMCRSISFIILAITISSCNQFNSDDPNELKYKGFSTSQTTDEIRSRDDYQSKSDDDWFLYLSPDNRSYSITVQKNHLDKTYAVLINFDIPRGLGVEEVANDILQKYKSVGNPLSYKPIFSDIWYSLEKTIVFGCRNCGSKAPPSCRDWYNDKTEIKMAMCVLIYSSAGSMYATGYWFSPREAQAFYDYLSAERNKNRPKMPF